MSDPNPPIDPVLSELLEIRERLNLVLETLSDQEMAGLMQEAKEFYAMIESLPDSEASNPASPSEEPGSGPIATP